MAIYGQQLINRHLDSSSLSAQHWEEWIKLKNWNGSFDVSSEEATVFDCWWKRLYHRIYDDEYLNTPGNIQWPSQTVCMEQLLKDSNYLFVDEIQTSNKESLRQMVTSAFTDALDSVKQLQVGHKAEWDKYQQTGIRHLLKFPAFSHLNLTTGGQAQALNATTSDHGQSWRMIVHLTPETEAYGIYPGGQSGNPGSPYYDAFIPSWSRQEYYRLWIMKEIETKDTRIKSVMTFGS